MLVGILDRLGWQFVSLVTSKSQLEITIFAKIPLKPTEQTTRKRQEALSICISLCSLNARAGSVWSKDNSKFIGNGKNFPCKFTTEMGSAKYFWHILDLGHKATEEKREHGWMHTWLSELKMNIKISVIKVSRRIWCSSWVATHRLCP